MNRPFSQKQKRNEKRINESIIARELIVISETSEPLGKMGREKALDLAGSKDLDLVEVGMQDGIPLAKILDYGKFQYEQQKQQAHNKQHAKKTELKTMKLTYKIGDHDIEIRRKQAESWAKEGHPMRITLQLRGRENQYELLAIAKIEEFIASLEPVYKKDPSQRVSKIGNNINITLYPKK